MSHMNKSYKLSNCTCIYFFLYSSYISYWGLFWTSSGFEVIKTDRCWRGCHTERVVWGEAAAPGGVFIFCSKVHLHEGRHQPKESFGTHYRPAMLCTYIWRLCMCVNVFCVYVCMSACLSVRLSFCLCLCVWVAVCLSLSMCMWFYIRVCVYVSNKLFVQCWKGVLQSGAASLWYVNI